MTNKYQKLKWAEPQWRASLAASRVRTSKVAPLKARSKAGRSKMPGKMPSLSSEG